MLFFVLVLLIALGVLSPYISVVIKRRKMLRRLTGIAKKSGFRVVRLHRFVGLSFNRGKKYDLLFECKTHAFAVKLWSAVHKNKALVIKSGRVFETSVRHQPLATGNNDESRTKGLEKRVPVTANNFKIRRGKPVTGILMFYPPYAEMTVEGTASKKTVTFGDKLFDKIICSPGGFEQMLYVNRADTEASDRVKKETQEVQDLEKQTNSMNSTKN